MQETVGPQAVLFDFDYTLGDSSQGIVLCANRAFEAMGMAPVAETAVKRTIGLPLEVMFAELTGRNGPSAARFRDLFIRCADREMGVRTELYPGVARLLLQLRQQALLLGVVTTKVRRRVEQILERTSLQTAFDVIIGSDMVEHPKPHPASLQLALNRLEIEASSALYVGDSWVDGQAAHAAGVPFAAVLTGTTPRHDLESYSPLCVLDRVTDLTRWWESRF